MPNLHTSVCYNKNKNYDKEQMWLLTAGHKETTEEGIQEMNIS
jgi:hypothetical protein